MLEPLLESTVKEKILLFLEVNDGSYPSEIARNFSFNINAVQFQLKKLEKAGVITSELRGKVRLYGLNPGYTFGRELETLLQKTLALVPAAEKGKYYARRRSLRQPEKSFEKSWTAEKAVKKEKQPEPRQYYPQKPESLDFSTD
jgi:DNA-binding transcriptional ArsR family regulator